MGGELSKGKHGGDRASGVEYVSSGNKVIKKRKIEEEGGGEGEDGHRFRAEHTSFLWRSGQVDDQFYDFLSFFFSDFSSSIEF